MKIKQTITHILNALYGLAVTELSILSILHMVTALQINFTNAYMFYWMAVSYKILALYFF